MAVAVRFQGVYFRFKTIQQKIFHLASTPKVFFPLTKILLLPARDRPKEILAKQFGNTTASGIGQTFGGSYEPFLARNEGFGEELKQDLTMHFRYT